MTDCENIAKIMDDLALGLTAAIGDISAGDAQSIYPDNHQVPRAYDLYRLSEDVGAYGFSLAGERPEHRLASRVEGALIGLEKGIKGESEIYEKNIACVISGTYVHILDEVMGKYNFGNVSVDDCDALALELLNATESILNSSLKNISEDINPRNLKDHMIKHPYKDASAFHKNKANRPSI
ncbi:MAG: hypothetical protein KAT83_01520 [Candidatus Aenigmarchaeota archaeon]|nr:hypothetical protein [Candidatus Aenigmarchaeota archaeon]